MNADEIRAELQAAAQDRAAAEEAKRKATRRLITAARQAKGKVPMREVAAAAGVSVQGLYDLLQGKYGS